MEYCEKTGQKIIRYSDGGSNYALAPMSVSYPSRKAWNSLTESEQAYFL